VTIRFCKRCLTPSSRPRVVFDDQGVCNACHTADQKQSIDWAARRREFEEQVAPYRSRDGRYDCVVPWSGGKDSSSIAWRLKFEFGLKPLLVTFSPLIPNEVGSHNREQMIEAGFDHFMVRPNQKISRYLARRFFIERGNPKVHWDAGVNTVPIQVAVNYNIPLVFYAEHGESEYGGRLLSEEHRKIRDFTEVIEHQVGDDPVNWVDDVVGLADLQPYIYPPLEAVRRVGVQALYFAYFFRWSMHENYQYLKDKIDFRLAAQGRTDGTFTNFDSLDDKIDDVYYYLQYIKFGFGRASRDASRLIHNKHMTREEAVVIARKYDGEFPRTHYDDVLKYLSMSNDEFAQIVDLHRNSEIWQMSGNEWRLRHSIE
jgi:N-acetyl sugar amidotransferase